jgi:Holliday junction DNA helicase RuvB
MAERVVSGKETEEEGKFELSLRPKRLDEYIGQDKVKENLRILIEAAKGRGEAIDHILLYGPPGLGKTTLAMIVARELDAGIRVTTGPTIEHAGAVASLLTMLKKRDVLFIDEIHRLNHLVEEVLYPAMEDFVVDVNLGKGLTSKITRIPLPQFTLIGATTRYAMVSSPLRDRFGAVYRLDFYDEKAMMEIVRRSAHILDVQIEEGAVLEIARRARGTPRVANRLLKRVRDYAQVRTEEKRVTVAVARDALEMLGVDELGLDETDHKVLSAVIKKFGGGPVGLETIAASISEESDTIMDVYEPYLLQLGFLNRTPRGRVATRGAYKHLGIEFPNRPEQLPLANNDKTE